MKDHSAFKGIKELHGKYGNIRLMKNCESVWSVYEEINGSFIHAGTINTPQRITNKKLYEMASTFLLNE